MPRPAPDSIAFHPGYLLAGNGRSIKQPESWLFIEAA
jgi:hypothetical protein